MVAVDQLESARVRRVLKGVYDYNIEVTVVDKDTNSRLFNVRTQLPRTSSNDLFQQSSGIESRADGIQRIFGVAYEPRKWTFGHEGYEDSMLTVDRVTPSSVRIKLNKLESNKSLLPTGISPTTSNPELPSRPAAE